MAAISLAKKVTYLLGAGASAGAIPAVKDMPKRLGEFVAFLRRSQIEMKSNGANSREMTLLHHLITDAEWLYGNLIAEVRDGKETLYRPEHDSVDAFAQILSLRSNGKAEVRRMKVLLSLFFVYEHDRWRCDTRYKSFLTNLLRRSNPLPNVKVLTWNYDACFEHAYLSVTDSEDFLEAQRFLNIISKNIDQRAPASGFSIIQLNGSANFHNPKKPRVNYRMEGDASIIDVLLNGYFVSRCDGHDRCETLMSYGWEPDGPGNGTSVFEIAAQACKNTNILVVIGYSFPDVNRDHDEQIIAQMGNLEKIIVQDPAASSVISHIKQFAPQIPCESAPGNSTGPFHIPRELLKSREL